MFLKLNVVNTLTKILCNLIVDLFDKIEISNKEKR